MADRDYTISGPDGRELTITGPDTATPAQLRAAAEKAFGSSTPAAAEQPSKLEQVIAGIKDFTGKDAVLGAIRGAAGIGATLQHALNPMEWGNSVADTERRQGIDQGLGTLGANPNSAQFKNAKLATEIAGTSGVGGLLGKGAQVLGAAPKVVNALSSAGFSTGTPAGGNVLARLGDTALRMGGGAATGAASTALVDPSSAGTVRRSVPRCPPGWLWPARRAAWSALRRAPPAARSAAMRSRPRWRHSPIARRNSASTSRRIGW